MLHHGALKFLCCVLLVQKGFSTIYFVDQNHASEDERDGTWKKPFKTITNCVEKLKKPGDECQIRAGTYHEDTINLSGLRGTPQQPIAIKGYGDERPKLDGTIEIKNQTKWIEVKKNIFKTKISSSIWQLFIDGEMMTNARWPNAKWSDKSIFNGHLWSRLDKGSKPGGTIIDHRLKNTGLNMNGAVAVLNIGSFTTFMAIVENHTAFSNKFDFKDTFGQYNFKYQRSQYFLEAKLELLDAPEEWYFDKNTMELYVYTPTGSSPYFSNLRGKVQSYAFKMVNCHHVILKNIDFFATTVSAKTYSNDNRVTGLRLDSLNFRYHICSKRMLGSIDLTQWLIIDGYHRERYAKIGNFTIFNNTFYGADGVALAFAGRNVKLENNLFEYNDWTGANMLKAQGGSATIKSFGLNNLFLRNTVRYNGASCGIRPSGRRPVVRLNHVYKQCSGLIMNDGAGIHLSLMSQYLSLIQNNWVHDTPKFGIRFDGGPPKRLGINGTMDGNVVFRSGGINSKGKWHTVKYNLAFMRVNKEMKPRNICALCVYKFLRGNPIPFNNHSITINNVADVGNGGTWHRNVWPIPGDVIRDNVFGTKVQYLLADPYNNDFRPLPESKVVEKNAGPYKYDEELKIYWIPGRQLYKPSSPVPIDGSMTVRSEHRDVLIWLNALNCYKHRVYYGTNKQTVQNAGKEESAVFIGETVEGSNVIHLKEEVQKLTTYYWRVDAICGSNVIYKGDVWSFTTI